MFRRVPTKMTVVSIEMRSFLPNIYFDRNPLGSSIGAHSFDPLVGLPDHSDPRIFHTGNSKDLSHLSAALQPTIDHFRAVTDRAKPREAPLDSGYKVAQVFLQARGSLPIVHIPLTITLFRSSVSWNGGKVGSSIGGLRATVP